MSEFAISQLEKKVNENPKNAINWLALIEAQLSAGLEMRLVGNTLLKVESKWKIDLWYYLGYHVAKIIIE